MDLTPELEKLARKGYKLYFTVDGHLNSLRNTLVGEIVAREIKNLIKTMRTEKGWAKQRTKDLRKLWTWVPDTHPGRQTFWETVLEERGR